MTFCLDAASKKQKVSRFLDLQPNGLLLPPFYFGSSLLLTINSTFPCDACDVLLLRQLMRMREPNMRWNNFARHFNSILPIYVRYSARHKIYSSAEIDLRNVGFGLFRIAFKYCRKYLRRVQKFMAFRNELNSSLHIYSQW